MLFVLASAAVNAAAGKVVLNCLIWINICLLSAAPSFYRTCAEPTLLRLYALC
jgi:hypothetical protein